MAVPKSKTSKQRRNKRRTHFKLAAPGLVECSQCHSLKMSHRVCKECGYYDGKEIIKAEA
ncbi:MAG: 50S ribosomal protein L32 [Clostridiaceae bacterium]|jgi:large subunit ribosomal protein L32|nr:50S ribosomal protein L32 [Clostridiaceae bacterium]